MSGLTDQMVALDCTRDADGYHCQTKLIPLTQAANTERKVPRAWINAAGNGVCQSFIDYALPLIQGEPARPLENGLRPGAAASVRPDVAAMTRAQREALERRVLHGAQIEL